MNDGLLQQSSVANRRRCKRGGGDGSKSTFVGCDCGIAPTSALEDISDSLAVAQDDSKQVA